MQLKLLPQEGHHGEWGFLGAQLLENVEGAVVCAILLIHQVGVHVEVEIYHVVYTRAQNGTLDSLLKLLKRLNHLGWLDRHPHRH